MVFQELFNPTVGNSAWQLYWSFFNMLLHGVAFAALLAFFHERWFKKKRNPNPARNWKETYQWWFWSGVCAFCSFSWFPILYYFNRFYDPTSPFNWILDGAYWLFNSVLSVETLLDHPFANLPSANITFRILLAAGFCYIVRCAFRLSRSCVGKFHEYLDEKFNAIIAPLDEKSKKKAEKFWNAVKILVLLFGGTTVGTIAVNAEGTKDYLLPALQWLQKVIEKVMDIANFPINPQTVGDMVYGLCVIFFACCAVLFLLTLIISFAAFLYHTVKNFTALLEHIKNNQDNFKRALKGIFIFLAVFSLIFVLIVKWDPIIHGLKGLVQNSPGAFLALLQELVLLAVAVCIFILILFFIYAVGRFCYDLLKKWMEQNLADNLTPEKRALITKLIMASVFFALLGVLFFLYYAPISKWLMAFYGVDQGDFAWVLKKMVFTALMLLAATACLLFVGGVLVAAGTEVLGLLNLSDKNNALRLLFKAVFGKIIKCLAAASILFDVIAELVKTIVRIFRGYRTESEKNSAVYVAATFASLASLINTFLGLYNFNRSEDVIWPMVTSLAISFAVQLAMLIFGMKAGQAMAENIFADSRAVGSSPIRSMVKKTFGCLAYLLAYLCVLTALDALIGEPGISFSLSLTLPNLLIWASTLGLAYAVLMEVLDIIFLWKHRKDNSGHAQDPLLGANMTKPKRMPARFYFAAYLLLMIVSTGFAFNNLFGCYANQMKVHAQVYDQIRTKTESAVRVQLNGVITEYTTAQNALLGNVREYIEQVQANHNVAAPVLKKANDDEIVAQKKTHVARNAYAAFSATTIDLPMFYETLNRLVAMDYDHVGQDASITVYTYDHYSGNGLSPYYTTYAMEIKFGSNGSESIKVGKIIPRIRMLEFIDDNGITRKLKATGRYFDPESEKQSIAEKAYLITNADKYDIINELLIVINSIDVDMTNQLKAVEANGGNGDGSPAAQPVTTSFNAYSLTNENAPDETTDPADLDSDNKLSAITQQLQSLEVMDRVRLSIVTLCEGDQGKGGILDLHRIVGEYLDPSVYSKETDEVVSETTVPPTGDEADSNQKPISVKWKDQAFQSLDAYITRALQICAILDSGAKPDAGSKTEEIRNYRNYAQGITNSDFQLSYDALLSGFGKLNTTGKTDDGEYNINALYNATTIAWFILLICLLVDFMAFFAGLLLFQDAFLLDMQQNEKRKRLGNINFDAVLTNYFMPSEQEGAAQKLRTALLYYLLYRRGSDLDTELLSKLNVDLVALEGMIQAADMFLAEYGVGKDYTDFHIWLRSFVLKNDVQFDDVLNGSDSAEAASDDSPNEHCNNNSQDVET